MICNICIIYAVTSEAMTWIPATCGLSKLPLVTSLLLVSDPGSGQRRGWVDLQRFESLQVEGHQGSLFLGTAWFFWILEKAEKAVLNIFFAMMIFRYLTKLGKKNPSPELDGSHAQISSFHQILPPWHSQSPHKSHDFLIFHRKWGLKCSSTKI